MKKWISLTLVLILSLSLTACKASGSGASTDSKAPTAEKTAETPKEEVTPSEAVPTAEATVADPEFTEKNLTVVKDSLENTETVSVRCYEDMPNVPYMSVTDFYNNFYLVNTDLTEGMTFTADGSKYTVTNFCDDKALFDTAADTIVIDNMTRFIKLACDLQSAETDGLDPDYPYAKISHSSDPENASPKTLALADYDIDLRGDETGVYAPVSTLADIFAAASGYYIVYAGEKIYVRDLVGLYLDSVMDDDPDYLTAVKADRAEDLTKYTYNELCFNMDLWYGMPGQEYIHDELANGSLDKVLTEKYPEIKEMLLASDFKSFYAGLNHVFSGLLFDGGHTGMGCDLLMDDEFELTTEIFKDVRSKDYGSSYNHMAERVAHGAQREEVRESIYNGDIYVEKGDTAMISLENEFTVDVDGWTALYAGEGDRPLADDTVGTILSGLERAAKNPKIKNIILDDSVNGGGNDIAMLAIEQLMTGKGYIRDKDALTSQISTKEEQFDLNSDGKIDDSDTSPYTDYNYGVLTSDGSFSCGNAFPWFMHEHGAMILGEKSSGGACGIRVSSVGGIEVRNSAASSCTVTEDGDTVDNGCPVDVDLTTDGENPYENFYDLDNLSKVMNEYFDGTKD